MRDGAWLQPLRRELDAAASIRTFFFRDDDAGWASDRLLALLDLFARHAVPLDLAVIPGALDEPLARNLRSRSESRPGLLAFHQHGFTHANHEPSGRPCEFGPSRPRSAQRSDIEAGAQRLRRLIGVTAPVFTPPWNRCTTTTGYCLRELGFRALVRDATASPLGIAGLQELAVHVDWCRPRPGEALAAAVRRGDTVGVMLHHALIEADDRREVERLLDLLSSHRNARCVPLRSLAAD